MVPHEFGYSSAQEEAGVAKAIPLRSAALGTCSCMAFWRHPAGMPGQGPEDFSRLQPDFHGPLRPDERQLLTLQEDLRVATENAQRRRVATGQKDLRVKGKTQPRLDPGANNRPLLRPARPIDPSEPRTYRAFGEDWRGPCGVAVETSLPKAAELRHDQMLQRPAL